MTRKRKTNLLTLLALLVVSGLIYWFSYNSTNLFSTKVESGVMHVTHVVDHRTCSIPEANIGVRITENAVEYEYYNSDTTYVRPIISLEVSRDVVKYQHTEVQDEEITLYHTKRHLLYYAVKGDGVTLVVTNLD